jgi:basic amino acid/polyamine antiporter, APA family
MVTSPSSPKSALSEGKLLNVLGLAFGVCVTVGGTIGVGILIQPGTVAKHLPNLWLFLASWLAGGLYVLLGAISVGELSAMIPRSGGFYVYVRRVFGTYPGFVTGWAQWLGMCCGGAFATMVLAKYTAMLVPAVAGWERVFAILTVIGFAVIQWRSVRDAGHLQVLSTVAKGVAFLAMIGGFLVFGGSESGTSPDAPLPEGWSLLAASVLAFQAILQTYDGWEGAIYFGEEIRDPGRSLPRSLIFGTTIIILVYFLMNLSLVCVLPLGRIAGHGFAVAGAAEEVFGTSGGTLIATLATFSILVSCNAGALQLPRILYAMSCDGLFLSRASRVNPGGTPTVALLLSTIAIVLFLVSGTFEELLSVIAFFLVTNYALLFIALFVLRWQEPNAVRPYRAWGYPWTTTLALLGSLLYLGAAVYTDSIHSIYALLLLLISYPIFILSQRFGRLSVPTYIPQEQDKNRRKEDST